MENRGLVFFVVASLVLAPVTTAFAQGGSGFNGGSISGNAEQSQQSQQSQSTSQAPTQGSGATRGNYLSLRGEKPGTAPNGKPIGSPGSGLGSPEDPYDARKPK
jgi:hypothetical protein